MLTHIHVHFIYLKISNLRTRPDKRYVDILAIYSTPAARIYFNIGQNRWFNDLTSSHSSLVGFIEFSKFVVTHPHVNCIGHRNACKPVRMISCLWNISALLTLCERNPPVTVVSSHRGQWRGVLMFTLMFAWTNGWAADSRDADDLRHDRAHCDVTLMWMSTR